MELTKQCLNCGTVFSKSKTDGMPRWKTRKYCRYKCAKQYQREHREGLYRTPKEYVKIREGYVDQPHSITECDEFEFKEGL